MTSQGWGKRMLNGESCPVGEIIVDLASVEKERDERLEEMNLQARWTAEQRERAEAAEADVKLLSDAARENEDMIERAKVASEAREETVLRASLIRMTDRLNLHLDAEEVHGTGCQCADHLAIQEARNILQGGTPWQVT